MSLSEIQSAFIRSEEIRQELTDDYSGQEAQRLTRYFDDAANAAKSLAEQALSATDRLVAVRLHQGFKHSAKLIGDVWSSLHGREYSFSTTSGSAE